MKLYLKQCLPYLFLILGSYLLLPQYFYLILYFSTLIYWTLYIAPQLTTRYSPLISRAVHCVMFLYSLFAFNYALLPLALPISGGWRFTMTAFIQLSVQRGLHYYYVYMIKKSVNELNHILHTLQIPVPSTFVFSPNMVTNFKYAHNGKMEDTTYSLKQTYWLEVIVADFTDTAINFYATLEAWEQKMRPAHKISYHSIENVTFLIRKKLLSYNSLPTVIYTPNIEIQLKQGEKIYLQNESISIVGEIADQLKEQKIVVHDPFNILDVLDKTRKEQEQHFDKRNKELGYPDFSNTTTPLRKK